MKRNLIRELRKQRGWTQAVLGARIGVIKETISRIERGAQGITSAQAHAFAEAFNVRIDDLYEDSRTPVAALMEEAARFQPEPGTFNSHIPLDPGQSWYRILDSHLDAIGLSDGAEVIIDIGKEALDNVRIGDVVIANKCESNNRQKCETIVRQFIPPALLITNSFLKNLPSLRIDSDDITVLGVIIHPRRTLQTSRLPKKDL